MLSKPTHDRLVSLASLEPSLDRLLLRGEPSRSSDYREPLETLREKLK